MEIDHADRLVRGGWWGPSVGSDVDDALADPQIEEFISIKQESGSHWTTNISVEVDAARSGTSIEANDAST